MSLFSSLLVRTPHASSFSKKFPPRLMQGLLAAAAIILSTPAARADTTMVDYTFSYGIVGLPGVSQSLSFSLPQVSTIASADSDYLRYSTQVTDGNSPESNPASVSFHDDMLSIDLAVGGDPSAQEYNLFPIRPYSDVVLSQIGDKGSLYSVTLQLGTYTSPSIVGDVEVQNQEFTLDDVSLAITGEASTVNLTNLPPPNLGTTTTSSSTLTAPPSNLTPASTPSAVTPEPSTLALLGTGLLGLGSLCKRRFV